jgi:hypothetical protein
MHLRRRLVVLGLGVLLALPILAADATLRGSVALAVPQCPTTRDYEIDRADASVSYNGAHASWELRTLGAPDYADGGHANTTLWLGTNGNIANTWVEVGATKGWKGANLYRFYAAHRYLSGGTYYYSDYLIGGVLPVIGHEAKFEVATSGTSYVARVTDTTTGSTDAYFFGNHAGPQDEWNVGAEYTCPTQSRIDKTYVYLNAYRRASDGAWLSASSGSLVKSGNSGTGMAWCISPVTFRFWVHSGIPTSGCT